MRSQETQIRINFYTNIVSLVATLAVGVYYTPYLVHRLGVAAYGVVPLALIINQYINVVTGSLTSAFSRFYSIAVQKENYEQASRDISSALVVVFLIIGICLPLMAALIYYIDTVFSIPAELVRSARLLFAFTISGFFVALISSLMHVTLFALNRLDIQNLLNIVRVLMKLLLLILFFTYIDIDLAYVGLANLVTEVLVLIMSIYFFYTVTPVRIRINLNKYSKTVTLAILAMATWVMVIQAGETGIYRIDNWIVNKFWGIEKSGILGAITELTTCIFLCTALVSTLFGPLIMRAYSDGEHEKMRQLAMNQSYIVGALAATLSGVVAGYAASILRLWLGPDFGQYSLWLEIKMIGIPFFGAAGVLAFVYRAWNQVRFPAVGIVIIGGINILIALSIGLFGGEYRSVALLIGSGIVVAVIPSYFLYVYVVNRIYPGNWVDYTFFAIKFLGIYALGLAFGKLVEHYLLIDNLLLLIAAFGATSILVLVIVYFLFFQSHHKKQLTSLIR